VPHRRALPLAALLAGVALVAACSLPDPAATGRGRAGRDDRATPTARAGGRPGQTRATGAPVRVVMNDRYRYRPDSIVVWAGRRVTFAVTNAGRLPHEFVLGDHAAQLDHERRMRLAPHDGGDAHDHGPTGHPTHGATGALTVPPGTTRHLTWTFDEPGIILYGCHVPGHWPAGMRGTILVLTPDRPLPTPLDASSPRPARGERPPRAGR
jgi:uncharacterized cupredoxin-like copper-binding protein